MTEMNCKKKEYSGNTECCVNGAILSFLSEKKSEVHKTWHTVNIKTEKYAYSEWTKIAS